MPEIAPLTKMGHDAAGEVTAGRQRERRERAEVQEKLDAVNETLREAFDLGEEG